MNDTSLVFLTPSENLADYWRRALGEGVQQPEVHTRLAHNGQGVVLLDLAALGGVFEPQIWLASGRWQLLVLSSVPSDEEGLEWLGRGAAGYLHAYATEDLLQQAVATVQAGGTWVGRSIMQILCGRFGSQVRPAGQAEWRKQLTGRETEVVEALRKGAANKEIARALDISERTVKAHLTAIFHKFDVADRLQLMLKLTQME